MSDTIRRQRALLALALALGAWLALAMPVFAQESYYWTYSQRPALSYFDHPPMVAWLIWLGTRLFGDGALGIRLGTLLCGSGLVLVGLRLLRDMGAGEGARTIWLSMCCAVPLLVVARFLANPDPALCLFWGATMLCLWRARQGALGWWLLAGVSAGCALLSKYSAAFLAAAGVVLLVFDPAMRRQLLRPGPWLGVLTAAVTFSPVVVWNATHEFASFRFQTSNRWSHAQLGVGWLGEAVGGQALMLHPVFFVLVPAAVGWLWRRARRERDDRALWLLAFGLPLPAFFLANALFVQVKINWFMPAYLPLLLGTALWLDGTGLPARWPVAHRWMRRLLAATAILFALAPLVRYAPQTGGSSWWGWDRIALRAEHWAQVIDRADGAAGNMFFFACDYKDAAQLQRSLEVAATDAGQDMPRGPTLAQNVFGDAALEYDYWDPPGGHVGQDAIFVVSRPERRQRTVEKVRQHFAGIEHVERVTIAPLGFPALEADIYVCRGYHGPLPPR